MLMVALHCLKGAAGVDPFCSFAPVPLEVLLFHVSVSLLGSTLCTLYRVDPRVFRSHEAVLYTHMILII